MVEDMQIEAVPQDQAKKFQPSRKNKRSWRKNIDIVQVEKTVEHLAEQERLLGYPMIAIVHLKVL
jgi:hypothetical protein